MKVLVCGSRHFKDWELMDGVLSAVLHDNDTLIHGCAKGADRMSEEWFSRGCSIGQARQVLRFPAEWDKYGKAAGPIRNSQMLKEGKPDLVVAFLYKDSKGTKNMVEQAKKAGVPVKEIWCD